MESYLKSRACTKQWSSAALVGLGLEPEPLSPCSPTQAPHFIPPPPHLHTPLLLTNLTTPPLIYTCLPHHSTPSRGLCRTPAFQCTLSENISLGTYFQWILGPLEWLMFNKEKLKNIYIPEGTKMAAYSLPNPCLFEHQEQWGTFQARHFLQEPYLILKHLTIPLLTKNLRFPSIYIKYPSRNPLWVK